VTARWRGSQPILFVLNHTNETVSVSLEKEYHDLLSDQIVSGKLEIPVKQVIILADNSSSMADVRAPEIQP
jgi:beta-galactosidase GanA